MRYTVTTPAPGFTGESVGVYFTDGRAEVDEQTHGPALAYFRAQGYGVEQIEATTEDRGPRRSARRTEETKP